MTWSRRDVFPACLRQTCPFHLAWCFEFAWKINTQCPRTRLTTRQSSVISRRRRRRRHPSRPLAPYNFEDYIAIQKSHGIFDPHNHEHNLALHNVPWQHRSNCAHRLTTINDDQKKTTSVRSAVSSASASYSALSTQSKGLYASVHTCTHARTHASIEYMQQAMRERDARVHQQHWRCITQERRLGPYLPRPPSGVAFFLLEGVALLALAMLLEYESFAAAFGSEQ